jgi:hypothetical protein
MTDFVHAPCGMQLGCQLQYVQPSAVWQLRQLQGSHVLAYC